VSADCQPDDARPNADDLVSKGHGIDSHICEHSPMITGARVVAFGLFVLTMLGLRYGARLVVAGGPTPWLIAMGMIIWAGVWLENRQRAEDGRSAYSMSEARADLLWPLIALAGILAVAWLLR
jgi:hypothetical protein